MKITKQRLRQIIKEEFSTVLENEGSIADWLENLKQVAMDYLIANPTLDGRPTEIADVPIGAILAYAKIDPNTSAEFGKINLDPEQKSWWLFGAKGIEDIHVGAREGAEEAEHLATDMPSAAPGNAPDKGPILSDLEETK